MGQSEPGSNSNEGVICIPRIPCITGTSTSDCLESYLGHLLMVSYLSAEKQQVNAAAAAEYTELMSKQFISDNSL